MNGRPGAGGGIARPCKAVQTIQKVGASRGPGLRTKAQNLRAAGPVEATDKLPMYHRRPRVQRDLRPKPIHPHTLVQPALDRKARAVQLLGHQSADHVLRRVLLRRQRTGASLGREVIAKASLIVETVAAHGVSEVPGGRPAIASSSRALTST